MPVSTLDLSVRASNCLESEGIQTVGDLVSRSEDEMLKLKNFGRTSLNEVKKKLQAMDLFAELRQFSLRRAALLDLGIQLLDLCFGGFDVVVHRRNQLPVGKENDTDGQGYTNPQPPVPRLSFER